MVTRTGLIPPQENRYRGNKMSQQNVATKRRNKTPNKQWADKKVAQKRLADLKTS
jgi:hypothetical protein